MSDDFYKDMIEMRKNIDKGRIRLEPIELPLKMCFYVTNRYGELIEIKQSELDTIRKKVAITLIIRNNNGTPIAIHHFNNKKDVFNFLKNIDKPVEPDTIMGFKIIYPKE